jgi:hypothetical protein
MNMIGCRNKSSHTYNSETAGELAAAIHDAYIIEFRKLYERMKDYAEKNN